ncbi:MAG: tripartite tricarboxylate transporter TctB family protein [Hyphomicrobiaceae bacterium]|nr:tripartite tricarboxylate transporter TctB family protein [Hyphomicrobiaceae bacterium]
MLLERAQAIAYVLLGAVSLADGWRISQQDRRAANFDAVGPDRYLLALGLLMLAAGLWRLLGARQAEPQPQQSAMGVSASVASQLILTLVTLAAFAALIPVLGFSLASPLFLAAQLQLLGAWAWWKNAIAAVMLALAFHATFVWFADIPLPKGYIWN